MTKIISTFEKWILPVALTFFAFQILRWMVKGFEIVGF